MGADIEAPAPTEAGGERLEQQATLRKIDP